MDAFRERVAEMSVPIGTMFTCPVCGSHYWGTSFTRWTRTGRMRIVKEVNDAYGHCKGWYMGDGRYHKCDFVWNRSEDEWVFHPYPDELPNSAP